MSRLRSLPWVEIDRDEYLRRWSAQLSTTASYEALLDGQRVEATEYGASPYSDGFLRVELPLGPAASRGARYFHRRP